MSTRARRTTAVAGTVVVIVAAWLALGPRQLGGPVSYVVVEGSSMEPLLHAGDIAAVREQHRYGPGDVVAFESHQLRTVVLHRIVEVDDGVLITKGDNNDWLDPEQPVEADVLGTLEWHVPRAGRILLALKEPRNAALAVGVLTVLLLGLGPRQAQPASTGTTGQRGDQAAAGTPTAGH